MPRRNYDDPYRDRQGWERELLRPDWGRPHPGDPNWADGRYHGLRTGGGSWQARYGTYRENHADELGGWGGVDGHYSHLAGGFDREGLLRYEGRRREDARRGTPPEYGREMREREAGWQGGGVREGIGYLRQFNSRSPELRYEDDYRRSYGWADRAHHGGHYPDEGPTRERDYAGYNRAGWAPGTWPGPGSRASSGR